MEEDSTPRSQDSDAGIDESVTTSPNSDQILTVPPGFKNRCSPLRSSLRKHGDRHKSPAGRKTVSFISQNSDKKVSNVADCLQLMQRGTEMIKLRTNVRQFRRIFSLDADLSHIRWTPTNKKPHKARIPVDAIKEIRVGRNSELLRASENTNVEMQDECAFSVIHGDEYECLDLIALTADDANIWVTGLMALSSGSRIENQPSGSMATLRERWLGSAFDDSDTDQKGYISEKTAVRLTRTINPKLLTSRVKQKVKEVSTSVQNDLLRGRIDRGQFIEIYKDVATRPEVYFLMVRYANKDYLAWQDLQNFLETEQGMISVTQELCEHRIDQFEPSAEGKKNHFMTVDGFTNFLLSEESSIFDPVHHTVCHDMDHPFSHYFIATSHNTYLVEDQDFRWNVISGLPPPQDRLQYQTFMARQIEELAISGLVTLGYDSLGAEIDVWEPTEIDPQEPVVYGGTLTTKLPLSTALTIINELAFEKTNFPLFIRLEMHLALEWQKVLVEALNSHLGSKLYHPAEDPIEWTLPENQPTPKQFCDKIILVGNRYATVVDETVFETGEVTEEDEGCDLQTGKSKKERRIEICKSLAELIAPFAQSKQIKDLNSFSGISKLSPYKHVLSMTEANCLRMIHNQTSTFSQLARDFQLRVTPNSARVDSSNQ